MLYFGKMKSVSLECFARVLKRGYDVFLILWIFFGGISVLLPFLTLDLWLSDFVVDMSIS